MKRSSHTLENVFDFSADQQGRESQELRPKLYHDHDDAWLLGGWSAVKSFCQKLEPFLLSPREQIVPLLEKKIVPVHSGVKGAISSIVVTQCDSSHDHTAWLLETFRTRTICLFTYSLPNTC